MRNLNHPTNERKLPQILKTISIRIISPLHGTNQQKTLILKLKLFFSFLFLKQKIRFKNVKKKIDFMHLNHSNLIYNLYRCLIIPL
jgi:hypothetical protein